eukprot:364781-Chlamydomonas_euryale.AAC.1
MVCVPWACYKLQRRSLIGTEGTSLRPAFGVHGCKAACPRAGLEAAGTSAVAVSEHCAECTAPSASKSYAQ